jgi:hypothetical protein
MQTRVALGLIATALIGSAVHLSAKDSPGLPATPSSQRIQNARADADDLSRMTDARMIRRFENAGLLVPVPRSTSSFYLHQVPGQYAFLRPWSRLFLTRFSRQFHQRFGARLRVTGLVRSAAYQRILGGRNGNAAAATGPTRSSHLTGATLDISKRFMTAAQIQWMRRVLRQLHDRQVLYAVEEFAQPCFHVMVHRGYEDYVDEITAP